MSEPLEPLDPDLARLLVAERASDGVPDDADAIFARLGVTMGWPPPGGSGGDGGPGPTGGGGGGGAGAAVATASLVKKGIALAVLSFAAGAVTQAAVVSPPARPAPVASIATATAAVAKADPPPVVADDALPPSATVVASAPARLAPHASAAAPSASTEAALAQERDLVQGARMAFVRGQTAAARALLDDHERRFPRGQLVEEREALRIQALAREGRLDEARARAERFRRAFPQSLSLAAIDAALSAPR